MRNTRSILALGLLAAIVGCKKEPTADSAPPAPPPAVNSAPVKPPPAPATGPVITVTPTPPTTAPTVDVHKLLDGVRTAVAKEKWDDAEANLKKLNQAKGHLPIDAQGQIEKAQAELSAARRTARMRAATGPSSAPAAQEFNK